MNPLPDTRPCGGLLHADLPPGTPTMRRPVPGHNVRYASPDWLHGQRGLSAVKAQMVIGTGVQPLFG